MTMFFVHIRGSCSCRTALRIRDECAFGLLSMEQSNCDGYNDSHSNICSKDHDYGKHGSRNACREADIASECTEQSRRPIEWLSGESIGALQQSLQRRAVWTHHACAVCSQVPSGASMRCVHATVAALGHHSGMLSVRVDRSVPNRARMDHCHQRFEFSES